MDPTARKSPGAQTPGLVACLDESRLVRLADADLAFRPGILREATLILHRFEIFLGHALHQQAIAFHDHAVERHDRLIPPEAEEAAVGHHDEELLALRILDDPIDGAELLALIVVDLTALDLGDGNLLLLSRADSARRLRLLADAERVARLTLLHGLTRLLLRLLARLHLLLAGLLLRLLLLTGLLTFRHALDADLRLAFLLLELHLRLTGALERHLRLGLFGTHLRLRLLGLYLRLSLLDLNLRLGLRYRDLRLRHAYDNLGLRLLHDDGRRGLTHDDLRRLLLDIDLSGLLLNPDLSTCRILLLRLLLLTRLLSGLSLLLAAKLDWLLILDRLELRLLLFTERLSTLKLAVLAHAMGDKLIALHIDTVDRQENLALILRHLDHQELLGTLAINDARDRADRLALFADDFAIHQFSNRNFLKLTGLHLLLTGLPRLRLLARLHLARLLLHLLLRLTRLRLGLLCARRHGNHRRGTEKRCK